MSELVIIKDKQFRPFISEQQIASTVNRIAQSINLDLVSEFPIFLVVLNGSFMFASDLLKLVNISCEISFIKIASYEGVLSSGNTTELIGLTENIENRTVVIVEDIVDTGLTIEKLKNTLAQKKVKQIKVASMLLKPLESNAKHKIDYIGIEIPNDFVIGYGLDYDGLGRNLKEIYILA